MYKRAVVNIDRFDERRCVKFPVEKFVVCEHYDAIIFKYEKTHYPSLCCQNGKIKVERMPSNVPDEIKRLATGDDEDAQTYKQNIIEINGLLGFTSIGFGKKFDNKKLSGGDDDNLDISAKLHLRGTGPPQNRRSSPFLEQGQRQLTELLSNPL